MYDAIKSRYTYPGTQVLRNKLNITSNDKLDMYQKKIVSLKLVAIDKFDFGNKFDANRLKSINRYLFDDIYDFAGQYRMENITKENFRFAQYEYIEENINIIMGKIVPEYFTKLAQCEFVEKISYIMTELNVLHPFREGNGRTIREFIRQLCIFCGYAINWSKIDYNDILKASKMAVIDESTQIELLKKSIRKMN